MVFQRCHWPFMSFFSLWSQGAELELFQRPCFLLLFQSDPACWLPSAALLELEGEGGSATSDGGQALRATFAPVLLGLDYSSTLLRLTGSAGAACCNLSTVGEGWWLCGKINF